MQRLYSKAFENRSGVFDPQLRKARKSFFKAAGSNFLLLQALFLGLFCWVFGSLYQQTDHTHNITILFVDYDGGLVGAAVREAYQSLEGLHFPSLIEDVPVAWKSPDVLEEAVCRTYYWAALYVSRGSSEKLQAVLTRGTDASELNRSNVLAYIWNEARYSSVVDSVISSSIQTLSSSARIVYTTTIGTAGIQNLTSPEAVSVFAEPWHLTGVDIQPTTQGSRAIYNTLVIILILIQEFFYLATLNGLYVSHRLYSRLPPRRMVIVRDIISLLYCLIGSLCTTGAIWAFRAGWKVNGKQFVLNWMALWLFAHINFLQLDVFTIWLPPAYVPMALISWVIFNVTSILLPFELSPKFYRIGYAAPAHEVYQILIDIWSRGCNPRLRYALPILIAWWILGLLMSGLGVYRRSHYAFLKEQEEASQSQKRVDAAVDFERGRARELEEKSRSTMLAPDGTLSKAPENSSSKPADVRPEEGDTTTMRAELADVISRENSLIRREQSRDDKDFSFGPAFSLPFGRTAESDEDG